MLTTNVEISMEKISKEITAIEKFVGTLPEKAIGLGVRTIIAAVLLFAGAKLIKLIRKITKKSLERANAETGLMQFIDGIVKMGLYGLLVLVIAGNFGVDATSIVALAGSVGVTIGLALQGSLSNIAGGVLILVSKPFKVGDYIMENAFGNEGTVKEIGILYTRLETFDGKMVVLPNGGLANNSITNATYTYMRRMDLRFGIAYEADIAKAKGILMNILENDEDVLQNEPKQAFVSNLADSSVELALRCFCENAKYWDLRWRLLENVKLSFDAEGIKIPYPQVEIHMSNG